MVTSCFFSTHLRQHDNQGMSLPLHRYTTNKSGSCKVPSPRYIPMIMAGEISIHITRIRRQMKQSCKEE
ncbi:hypothetical protein [Methanospirillum lacunae]|uniref:hypothetical protein n=1 Tax=Methanospirillum lacunae TaxID=668570 RepID=UPI0038FCEBEA